MDAKAVHKIGIGKINLHCTVKQFRLFCMAVSRSGHIIATNTNRRGTGAVSQFSIHAEEGLISKLRKIHALERYGPITMIVMRMKKDGKMGMAKPCPACHSLIVDYGIERMHYTDHEGKFIEEKIL